MRKLAVLVVVLGCGSAAQPTTPAKAPEPTMVEKLREEGLAGGWTPQEGDPGSHTATGSLLGDDDKNAGNDSWGGSSISGDDGTGWGTLDTGRYGTIGHGTGKGTTTVGQGVTRGDLDKDVIRRYVRQHLPGIRACYEKELASKPTLAGRATVSFQIKPDGTVGNAVGSGMPPVDACVAGVIATIRFPSPRGGGSVDVTYPFEFRP